MEYDPIQYDQYEYNNYLINILSTISTEEALKFIIRNKEEIEKFPIAVQTRDEFMVKAYNQALYKIPKLD